MISFFFTALVGRRLLGLSPTDVASVLPATTTTGLALTMPAALPAAKEEWVPISTIFCGVAGMSLGPFILRATALRTASPLAQGFALGSASHVSVVAALTQANNHPAAMCDTLLQKAFGTRLPWIRPCLDVFNMISSQSRCFSLFQC